jgi:hypothetical protein
LPDRKYDGFYRVCDPHPWNPGEAPCWSFQTRRCHLFHLFYQVQIRLGSPRSSADCFPFLFAAGLTATASPRPFIQRPASALSDPDETPTLWQF